MNNLDGVIMKNRNLTHDDIPETYADLVGLFMPRPLHDEVDNNNVLMILDAMAGFEMNANQEDFFEALSMFVEKYESEHHSIESQN